MKKSKIVDSQLIAHQIVTRKMREAFFVLLFIVSSFFSGNLSANSPIASNTLKIGVLAYHGNQKAISQWQPTIDILTQTIDGYQFELVPLSLQEITQHVRNESIDFVVTNTGNYIELSHLYGVSRIATLVNSKNQATTDNFGAVIFTRANRNDINSLKDINGKTLYAVNDSGFGGFYMAWYEFLKQDINLQSEAKKITFTGFPQDQVLHAVMDGTADVGTFRTDSLEQLVESENFNLSNIKILNPQARENFPFLLSTDLYPEWPFSKLKHTSRVQAKQVALALLSIKSNSEAARAAKISGWTTPLNYKPAYDLLKSLNVPPFKISHKPTIDEVIHEYSGVIVTTITMLLLGSFLIYFIYTLNIKLRTSNKLLKSEIRNRTRLANKLEYLASHDALTNLLNRRAFTNSLERELERAKRYHGKFSIMLLDIDKFKLINDEFGHHTGDLILVSIAKRINKLLRSNDIFCRIGGDEFAIINLDIESSHDVDTLCDRIHQALEPNYILNDYAISSSISIGYAIFPDNGNDINSLTSFADKNMYTNKNTKTTIGKLISKKHNSPEQAI